MNRTSMENACVAWVKAALTGITTRVIVAKQGTAHPAKPYATVHVGPSLREGSLVEEFVEHALDVLGQPDALQTINHLSQEELVVSVEVITEAVGGSSSAVDLAQKVKMALEVSTIRDALKAAGLSPRDVDGPVDLGEVVEQGWRGRARLDVHMGVADNVTENVSWIEHCEPSGTLH